MNSAIMEFGRMLRKSTNISTVKRSPTFAWAADGDIVIMGKAPEDFHGRVCSVKLPDEETPLFSRLYKDGENVLLGYMDDYDVWKSYPAETVTVLGEVLAVVHLCEPMERPKAETAWDKRVKRAAKDAFHSVWADAHPVGFTVLTLALNGLVVLWIELLNDSDHILGGDLFADTQLTQFFSHSRTSRRA